MVERIEKEGTKNAKNYANFPDVEAITNAAYVKI